MIRIVLPYHLQILARVKGEVVVQVDGQPTLKSVLEALESRHPVLRGTIRDHATGKRRPFLRFYACQQDLSLEPFDVELPEAIASGKEPLRIIGAIAGG